MNQLVVFLDTTEYKRCGHYFDSSPMRKLRTLVDKNIVRLISTTVVNGEVKEHIEEDVEFFLFAQKNLAKCAGVVQNISEYNDIIRRIDPEDLKQKARLAFTSFISSTQCEILSCNKIDNDSLLDDFFSKRPPFEARKDKAAEFKDAFTAYALKQYAKDNNLKIIIVSADKGFCASFDNDSRFKTFSKLEELFSYITYVDDEVPQSNANLIKMYVNQSFNRLILLNQLKEAIWDEGVWVNGATDECDINNIEVKNIDLSYVDDIEDHTIVAHYNATVVLTVRYSSVDETNSYWDSEEGTYLFLSKLNMQIEKELNLDFCVTFSVDENADGHIESINDIEEIVIDEDTRYGIEIDPNSDGVNVLYASVDEVYKRGYEPET